MFINIIDGLIVYRKVIACFCDKNALNYDENTLNYDENT